MTVVKQRHIRPGDRLDDDATLVVRGGRLDPDVLVADAIRHHRVYGSYAISVFALRAASLDELAQQAPLVRFGQLSLTTAGAIRTSGLELTAAGRNPHHFSVDFASLMDGVTALCNCEHRLVDNPYHES